MTTVITTDQSPSCQQSVRLIIERAVHSQLHNYLQENNLLHGRQYGFRHNRSTSSALLKFTDDILNNMEYGSVTGVVYLDQRKAFDKVNHSILLRKMKVTGVDDVSIKWFKSYLNNRTERTVLGNAISSSRIVKTGVPQGSVLGPLLFLGYINDLTERFNHNVA